MGPTVAPGDTEGWFHTPQCMVNTDHQSGITWAMENKAYLRTIWADTGVWWYCGNPIIVCVG